MTVDELIKALQAMKRAHGDIVVGVAVAAADGAIDLYSVKKIAYAENLPSPAPDDVRLAVVVTEF